MLFVTLLLAGAQAASAQTTPRVVKGSVRDSTGLLLPGASVRLATPHDTLSTITRSDGTFEIPHVTESRFSLLVYMMSYAGFKQDYTFPAGDSVARVGVITLQPNVHQLKPVTVKGAAMAVSFHGDTVEYSTSAYPVREGSSVGEVVKRLPGVDVDHNGKVTAQGKDITRIRVNGKDFFGTDINKALKNLPADIIDKLQVIDDYGDQANLSGVKTGEPQKIINLTLKPDKQSGAFGNATLAGGSSGRYLGSANVNRFKGEQQLSIVGDLNNTNAAAFSFGDNGGINGGDGSTLTHSAGINYRDQFSKKLMGYGSYTYTDSKSVITGVTEQQTIDANYVNVNNQDNTNTSTNKSHNLNYNLEYKIDTLNFLKVSPNLSWNDGGATGVSQFHVEQQNLHPVKISDGATTTGNTNTSPTANGNVMYNHRFLKKGRNLNVSATFSYSDGKSVQDTRTLTHIGYVDSITVDTSLHQQVNNDNGNSNINARLSYTEPLDSSSLLEFNYSFTSTRSNTLRETWNIDPADIKTRVDSQ
ncbi:MAG TPA: TonB-dependent receptor, partial [Chitinophaga sp.]